MTALLNLQRDIPLAPLTTFKIGGRARLFTRASTEAELIEAVAYAGGQNIDVFILGGGSNVLISDNGFDGLVIQIAIKGITESPELDGKIIIKAGAGEDWDAFVEHCVDNGLAGIECLSGIPGLVGGTPVQNVGAYGQEVSEVIESVRCFDRTTGEVVTLSTAQCGFSYRTSKFNSVCRDQYIVLGVRFALSRGGAARVTYKDLLEHFAGSQPTLREVREAVLTIRRSKSMVIDPTDPNSRSAGSFFKNPIVEWEKLAEIETRYDDSVPHFEFGDKVKIPAAWLIGKAGFERGFIMGEAAISSNHNLALINRGRACAADIIALKEKIRQQVNAKFGISLVPEPVFVGF